MHGIKELGVAILLILTISPAVSAQDASVLLEQAIYTEETLGNLDDAINIYKQVVGAADADRYTIALALYRLGTCYRKSGDGAEALAAFSKLARLYPEQTDLISKALLLDLKPAPWADGEIMRLVQKFKGNEAGLGVYSAESSRENGKPIWDLRYFFGFTRNPIYYSVTQADAATLLPITNRTVTNQVNLQARYSSQYIEVSNLKDNTQPPKQILSTGNVYDAWQIVPLLRCLPLREGARFTIPMFEATSGSFGNVIFSVVAREAITVPAGTFDCYKIIMTSDNDIPTDQLFWITADSHAYLARAFINATNEFELKSVNVVGRNQMIEFVDPESGISLTVPRQWNPWEVRQGNLMFLAPEFESSMNAMILDTASGCPWYPYIVRWSNLMPLPTVVFEASMNLMRPNTTSECPSISLIVDERIEAYNQYEDYPVRIRENVEVAGLAGERYIADTSDSVSGEPMVEYVYCLASKEKMYFFTFQTGSDNFDTMRPAFESILSSLKVQ